MIIIIVINLINIAQFDTNGILTALYIVPKYMQNSICAHMDIHETIMFIPIHVYTCIHVHTLPHVTINL